MTYLINFVIFYYMRRNTAYCLILAGLVILIMGVVANTVISFLGGYMMILLGIFYNLYIDHQELTEMKARIKARLDAEEKLETENEKEDEGL